VYFISTEKLEETKNQQRQQLKERIQARKAKLERERAQHKNEQTQLITQQEEVMDQVLKMQVGLTEEYVPRPRPKHLANLI
jgi:TolA-binding protein